MKQHSRENERSMSQMTFVYQLSLSCHINCINCHCIKWHCINVIVSIVKDINCINFSCKLYNMPENMYFALGFWWFDIYFRIVFTVFPVKKLKNVSLSCVSWYYSVPVSYYRNWTVKAKYSHSVLLGNSCMIFSR